MNYDCFCLFLLFSNQLPSSGNNNHFSSEKFLSHIMRSDFYPCSPILQPIYFGGRREGERWECNPSLANQSTSQSNWLRNEPIKLGHLESCCVNDYHYKISHNKTTQDSVLTTTSIHHRSVGLLALPSFKLLTGCRSAPRLSSSLDWQQSEWNSLSDIWLRHKSS